MKPLTLESTLDVQSNPNTYAANFHLDGTPDPISYEFTYLTTGGHRAPHFQIYSTKVGRKGNRLSFSFGFLLMDYPIDPKTEKLTLRCKFSFPESK